MPDYMCEVSESSTLTCSVNFTFIPQVVKIQLDLDDGKRLSMPLLLDMEVKTMMRRILSIRSAQGTKAERILSSGTDPMS